MDYSPGGPKGVEHDLATKEQQFFYFINFLCIHLFMAVSCGTQDLSSPTKDQTSAVEAGASWHYYENGFDPQAS